MEDKNYVAKFKQGRAVKLTATCIQEAAGKLIGEYGWETDEVIITQPESGLWEVFIRGSAQANKAELNTASDKESAFQTTVYSDAEASLSSADILLKQQIAKLEEIRVIAVWFWWWFIGASLIAMVLFLLLLTGVVVIGGR